MAPPGSECGTSFIGRFRRPAVLVATALLPGCTGAPALNVVGSFFPAWMFAALVGLVATVCFRQVLLVLDLERHLVVPLLTHGLIAVAVTLAIWLLWFGH